MWVGESNYLKTIDVRERYFFYSGKSKKKIVLFKDG
jgi:hypothetical protein